MANTYFDFKQFRIEQEACGMKVSTDACILGAWAPLPKGQSRILDIGAGTGLLSLMMAQRAPEAVIDALELDEAAALQARANCAASPFNARIKVFQGDIRSWRSSFKYDVIICNPPFFINSLAGPQASRNLARHDITLQQADLIKAFSALLKDDGYAALLWPVAEGRLFTGLAATAGWHLQQQLQVSDVAWAPVKRVVNIYARNTPPGVYNSLFIKDESSNYTKAFTDLLRPFYLDL